MISFMIASESVRKNSERVGHFVLSKSHSLQILLVFAESYVNHVM